ncbi:hypothetical protein [Halobacteriaceae bacterium SHR40]|uniref:hypothetical protein n=1 Tax=Halovenus amylolytica TaxID=2500550 RepID=UPI000FE43F02
MSIAAKLRDVIFFTTLYILLSFVPFVALNREIIDAVRDRIAPLDIVTLATIGTGIFLIITVLLLAEEGVDRYNQFLFAPTDLLSVVIELSFLLAAVSWWVVPELTSRYQEGITLDTLLLVILLCQLPMLLFLSLMTAVGKA